MDWCDCQGHIVGMLDRDQRTAKLCVFDKHVVSVNECEDSQDRTVLTRRNKTLSHSSVPGRTSPHSSCKTRKSGHSWKSLHRLKHALVVGTYLSLLSIPGVSSVPVRRSMSSRDSAVQNWIDPCGLNGAASEVPPPNSSLVRLIVTQTTRTLRETENLMEEFPRKTFKMDRDQLHNNYKDVDYNWMPTKQLPKSLGEQIEQERLESLELQPTLLSVYESLQKFAVVLEQIVWDEEKRNGDFRSKFENISAHLHTLLCEVNTAIIENHLTVKDVTREDLPSDLKNLDNNTTINMRNWIVYRDYVNMLEYILQVFKHFETTLTP